MASIDPKYYYLTLGLLALCTVVGLFFVFRLQREVSVDDAPPTEQDVLSPLEKAYYSGLMNEDEFKRIQASMAKQAAGQPLVPKRTKVKKERVETPTIPDEPETEVDDPLEPETEVDPH